MIKFFRKIRQNLLFSGKTSKYFKYAIGEILLVVIGILIALAINNWNQERLDQKRANEYLKSLTLDLKSDLRQYDLNIEYYEKSIAENSRVLQNGKYKEEEVDAIFNFVINYAQVTRVSTQTYEKIKNAGFIESLGSDEINQGINEYYNIKVPYYKELLQWDENYTEQDYNFWLYNSEFESNSNRDYDISMLSFRDSPAKRKADLIKLIESIQGRNHIRNAILRRMHLSFKINELKVKTQELLALVNTEITK